MTHTHSPDIEPHASALVVGGRVVDDAYPCLPDLPHGSLPAPPA